MFLESPPYTHYPWLYFAIECPVYEYKTLQNQAIKPLASALFSSLKF